MNHQQPLSLFEIINLLWAHRRTLVICIGITYAISFAYVFFAEKQYSTSMVISPIQDDRSTQIGNLVRAFTGSEGSSISRTDGMAEFLHLLTSADIAEELLNDSRIMTTIFSGEWNSETKHWEAPMNPFALAKRLAYKALGYPGYTEPSAFRLSEILRKAVVIEPIKGSKLISVLYSNSDKSFSEYLLEKLFHLADKFLRQKKIEKTYQTIDHLNKRIGNVENIVHRKSLADLLLYYEQELILLETDQPFAARKLGTSRSSDFPVSPNLKKILIICTALALLLGAAFILLRNRLK